MGRRPASLAVLLWLSGAGPAAGAGAPALPLADGACVERALASGALSAESLRTRNQQMADFGPKTFELVFESGHTYGAIGAED